MVYQFKRGAHVPAGITADAIVTERDAIEKKLGGKFTSEGATTQVLSFPDDYPTLRAVCPTDPEDAMFIVSRQRITQVISYVIPYRETNGNGHAPETRSFHWVPDPDGGDKLVNKSIEIIAADKTMREYLWEELEHDADSYSRKMRDTIAELKRLG